LFVGEVANKRLFSIPEEAKPLAPWPLEAGAQATFEKMEIGRVRLLPGDFYEATLAAAGANADALAAVAALLDRAKWERAQRITVPVQMAWHLFGPKIIRGAIYVHPTSECFELWAERYYERWVLERRDHLPA
jgi:hypothetical protein